YLKLSQISLQLSDVWNLSVSNYGIACCNQHSIPFSIFLLFANVAGIIQFNNGQYIIVTIKHHKICNFTIELITHVHLVMRNQGAKGNLSQNMMMRKGFF